MSASDPARPPETRTLEVVVVAYGDPGQLDTCLGWVADRWSVIVVDNSSSPATRAVVEAHGGRYLDPGHNLGFGAGVNHALRHAVQAPADVLLLNPDATVTPAAVGQLQARLLEDPGLACVAPGQIDPADGQPGRVCWPLPSPGGAWLDALGLGRWRRQCGFVIGAVLLLRAEALAEVGAFDERFFLYAEETDWQIRARRAGWRVAWFPEVAATHVGAGTGGDPTRRETHFHASHERLIRKHHGAAGWQVYRAAAATGALVRALTRRGEAAEAARRRLRLYLRGPCRCEAALPGDPQ